ncbi:hypothetical protein Pcinc_014463 [Petrolisthes cinctipes]|uniref:Uncharacterized protein n=1 Tax=Petrolisthes cinctipes TaxID=88211 RepID=A0AAE1KT76_PETCI|nr:hypothetical protein Pcinc_014463 [Petrolisthes cinctipes]
MVIEVVIVLMVIEVVVIVLIVIEVMVIELIVIGVVVIEVMVNEVMVIEVVIVLMVIGGDVDISSLVTERIAASDLHSVGHNEQHVTHQPWLNKGWESWTS